MKNVKELNYMASTIASLSCYFVDGYSVDDLLEGYRNCNPSEIYGTDDMLKHNISIIMSHLSSNTPITDNTYDISSKSGYINCTSSNNNIFGIDYDEIGIDNESIEYLKSIESNFINKLSSIDLSQNQEELKNFLKSLAEFSKSLDSMNSDTEELNKFRSIMRKCDFVVRETTKNSPSPSSIDSLESFDVYTTQANEAWIHAENCKMFSATGLYIDPIVKINELYNENNKMTEKISQLKAQLAEKEKEIAEKEKKISELKNKKPVNNNK